MLNIVDINQRAMRECVEFIKKSDDEYVKRVSAVSDRIAKMKSEHSIIMLAGPSGSGKTTTAAVLSAQLKSYGIGAKVISLDNFFLGTGRTPILPNGEEDVETVNALDIELMHKCMMSLIKYGRCDMPHFNFFTKKPDDHTVPVVLGESDIAIFEGIHAMNPVITDALPSDSLFKLYVSIEDAIFKEGEEFLSMRELRLVRRTIRDNIFRDSGPVRTLKLWQRVVECEDKYLFPYRKDADMTVNTFHSYEPCVFAREACSLFGSVKRDEFGYQTAKVMAEKMSEFVDINMSLLTPECMLHEFVGGGIYEY